MMNNRGVSIRYGDVAPEAKENFVPTASESEFNTLAQLQQYNLNFPNHANPCELYSVVLDGTATAFPSVPEQANLGLWSESVSSEENNKPITTKTPVYFEDNTYIQGGLELSCSQGVILLNGMAGGSSGVQIVTPRLYVTLNAGTYVIKLGDMPVELQSTPTFLIKFDEVGEDGRHVYPSSENLLCFNETSDLNVEHTITLTKTTKFGLAFGINKDLSFNNMEVPFSILKIEETETIINGYAFENPIVLTLTSVGQYSSQGLTLTFDTYNGIHPTRLSIKWLRITDEGITTLDEKEYTPDNAFYFCRNFVENYNKVVITFYSLNMPKNRLKLRVIDYGYGTFFYGDELRGVKLIQEIDPISTQISINTADFTLDSKTDMEYSFQAKQPLSVYFNGELKATTFVKKSTRKAKRLWSIQSEDYIGLLDSIPYYGGIYTNKNAVELLTDIFTVAKVPYSIDDVFADAVVTGYIPFTTCRDALMQVAFAIQAVVDTSNSEVVKVFALEDDVKQTIPLNRIMQGQNFADEETVTGVEVTVHAYEQNEETTDVTMVYNAREDGTGENIFVKFSEPLWGLQIKGDGEIVERNANYAIVNANSASFKLGGYLYEHTTQTRRKNNPVVSASDVEKIVAIDNATLISAHNIDKIIEKCYNWLIKTNTTNLKIVEGKHVEYGGIVKFGNHKFGEVKFGESLPNVVTYDEAVNIGDNIKAETEYLGVVGGRLIKQSFNLNGNIIVKEAVLK